MYWKLWTAEAPFGGTLLPLTSGKMERYSCWPDFVPQEWNTRSGSVSSYLPPPTQVFRVDPRYKAISPEVILEIPKSMQHRLGSAGSHPSPPGFLFSFVKFKSEKTCGANSRAFFTYSRIPSNSFLLVKLYIQFYSQFYTQLVLWMLYLHLFCFCLGKLRYMGNLLRLVVVWMLSPIGSCIWTFGPQLVVQFGKVKEAWPY